MRRGRWLIQLATIVGWAMAFCGAAAAQPRLMAGSTCTAPPRLNCPDGNCAPALTSVPGEAVEPKSGRKFHLDYPCDLKPGEKLTFVLSLHGAGRTGEWQRHYFPAVDYKEKYRLVIAAPTSDTSGRTWRADTDDVVLQNITDLVFETFGKANIRSFWLAGHSQGGITATRLVCSDFFKTKADGLLSLSGGRVGAIQYVPDFFAARPAAATPPPGGPPPPPAGARPAPAGPSCGMSYIFATGEHEITGLPETSPLADSYGCRPRVRRRDVVDVKGGYVTAQDQPQSPSRGRFARPGVAQVSAYPECRDGKLVADVLRLDKGHTEGLEPKVTEEILKMIVAAPGGRAQRD